MDARSVAPATVRSGTGPIRGILYAGLFGVAAWGGILAIAWAVGRLLR